MRKIHLVLNVTGMMLLSSFVSPAHSEKPHCYMHGSLVPSADERAQPTLADILRLNFDADSKEKCERMMTSYCYAHVKTKGYLPAKLAGTFRPRPEAREEFGYTFTPECKLQSE